MRKILSFAIVSILCISAAFAQIPAGYVTATGLLSPIATLPLSVPDVSNPDNDNGTNPNRPHLLGPQSGWNAPFFDVSSYGKLLINITFDADDAGKQVGMRYYAEGYGLGAFVSTYPTSGTSHNIEIDLEPLRKDGKVVLGGVILYNGVTNANFTYTAPATKPATVNYIALQTIQPTAIAVVPVNAALAQALPIGVSTTLEAQFTPTYTTNQAVTWSSADTDIATVDASTGVVTGVAAGNVNITATSTANSAISNSYNVVVTSVSTPVTGVTITSDIDLKMLNTTTLAYTVLPVAANNKTVTWSSSDNDIATVDATTGVITPVSAGTATITVKTEDGNFTDDCTVTVIGYEPIPTGYVSLYTLDFNVDGSTVSLGTTHGATLPAIFSSNGGSLLGTANNWAQNNRYADLADYDEVEVACYFQTADIGKKFDFRYCFSGVEPNSSPSNLGLKEVEIVSNVQKIKIDLTNDALDVAELRRLGAIKFRTISGSGDVSFNVDYVALKPTNKGPGLSIQSVEQNNDPVVAVKYYNLQGVEIPQALEGGISIVKKIHASSKVSVEKIVIK